MNSKIILLSVAVITVGLFAMPTTLSLFAGQHNFVSGDNVKCKKCHQDIYDNIQNSDMHKGLGDNGTTPWFSSVNNNSLGICVGCHRVSDASTNVTGIPSAAANRSIGFFNSTPGALGFGSTHTMVVTLECTQCHSDVPKQFLDVNETHQPYYLEALNGTTNKTIPLKGANEACIGCHTHTVVTINWTRPTGYNLNVTENVSAKYTLVFSQNTTMNQTVTTSNQ